MGLAENMDTSIWSLCYRTLQLTESLNQIVAAVDPVRARGFLRNIRILSSLTPPAFRKAKFCKS